MSLHLLLINIPDATPCTQATGGAADIFLCVLKHMTHLPAMVDGGAWP